MIHPASSTILRFDTLIGCGVSRIELRTLCRRREWRDSRGLIHRCACAELERRTAGHLAELASVLPDVHGLQAERDAIQRCPVTVLT